ncbi:sigma-70 family RNA polymerase sigma factor [Jannaschia sp. Os4]|uniref:RNA polymerase sigma factor n=1 Tax=Jannaschia sp. Os4 TaxID=2807617 RepID=UPI00193A7378|nr:sigma-70 family RNA polymerase sigma factor [Jannaschia sp. Os4]MBM2576048.1 sigma-70 family RNA polymerase sigma factor [Jannaschia sp. Os4]
MTGPDDTALLARIATGDRDALAAFYRRHERGLYRFILSRLNDPTEASDLLHDVFLEVWRVADRFEGRSKVTTWLFGIAWRRAADRHRSRARMAPTDDVPETADDAPAGEACLLAAQESEHVRHCMGTLKPDHRTAIGLAFWEDLSYREIAEVTGAPEGTVKTRVFHAKRLLLRCLEGRVARGAKA